MIESQFIPYQATTDLPARAVLAFAPHADDEVFGCGGALAAHAAAGVPVQVIVVTDGAAGFTGTERITNMATREAESGAAAAVLGYPAPEFWNFPDRGLCYGEPLIERIQKCIANSGADLIYAPSLLEVHPDHRALAMSVVEAVRRLAAVGLSGGLRVALYEIGTPLPSYVINILFDLTPVLAAKSDAMRCFVSQLRQQSYDEHVSALNRYRSYTLPKSVLAAEAFWLLDAAALASGWRQLFESEYVRQNRNGVPLLGQQDLPLVSVIIRSMDRHTLEQALNSLAWQSYSHFEIVVVDATGGRHRPLPERCGSAPLRLLLGEAPLMRSAAANFGMSQAHGDFLLLLDDDDWLLPHHLATLVAALQANPQAPAAYSDIRCVDSDGKPQGVVYDAPFVRGRLLVENFLPIHAVLFRRQVLTTDCHMHLDLDRYEDWDFWRQVARQGDFIHVPGVGGEYRIGNGSGFGVTAGDDAAQQARLLSLGWWAHWSEDDAAAVLQWARQNSYEVRKQQSQLSAQAEKLAVLARELERLEGMERAYPDAIRQLEAADANMRQQLAAYAALEKRSRPLFRRLTSSLHWLMRWLRGTTKGRA